jgi:hypothetical protein
MRWRELRVHHLRQSTECRARKLTRGICCSSHCLGGPSPVCIDASSVRYPAQRRSQLRNDLKDGALPKPRTRNFPPSDNRAKHDSLIPIKSSGGIGRGSRGHVPRSFSHGIGNLVVRIPKLARACVGDSVQRASTRRFPVRGKNRFPNNQDAEFPGRMLREKPFGCGSPPQAKGSRGRQQQDKAR